MMSRKDGDEGTVARRCSGGEAVGHRSRGGTSGEDVERCSAVVLCPGGPGARKSSKTVIIILWQFTVSVVLCSSRKRRSLYVFRS